MPAGPYEWIRPKINADPHDPDTEGGDDTYIVINGVVHDLTVPSGPRTGLKLVRGFEVPEGGAVSFTVDFDLRRSVITATGSGTSSRARTPRR